MQDRLTIANCNGGSVTSEFLVSITDTLSSDSRIQFAAMSSPYLVENRNRLVQDFLGSRREWLLMIDSDMEWDLRDIWKLRESADRVERPVVSGLYFHNFGSGASASPVAWGPGREPVEWRAGGVQEVSGFGAGFLLMHRGVLEKLTAVYGHPFDVEYEDGWMVGEDLVLCRRLRLLDVTPCVNCDVVVGHAKKVILRPNIGALVQESPKLLEAAV